MLVRVVHRRIRGVGGPGAPGVWGEVGHRVMPGILEVFRAVGKGEPGLEGVLQGRVRECRFLGKRTPVALI